MKRLIALAMLASCKHDPAEITVGAAISLKESMDEVASSKAEDKLLFTYGSSGELATQMLHGAPFDVLATAGVEPQLAGLADERCTLAWNTLVLVRHRDPALSEITWATLDKTRRSFRLAIGLAPQVPAGVYAEEALRKLEMWDAIAPKIVRGVNVRAVLDLVARGEADAGIVYATDAKVRTDMDVVGEVPAFARPDVRYPLYVKHGASERASKVAGLLCSDETRRVLVAHGFLGAKP